MRADYVFHYFSGGIDKPTLIASSNRGAHSTSAKNRKLLYKKHHSQTHTFNQQ
jgi:hypothetical protein